jgi:hypothetical protein
MAAGLGEGQAGDAGSAAGEYGHGDSGELVGSGDRVVAESFEAQQAPAGGEADLPQSGQVGQPLPIEKSRVSLMVVSVRRARPSLWYCLIVACL